MKVRNVDCGKRGSAALRVGLAGASKLRLVLLAAILLALVGAGSAAAAKQPLAKVTTKRAAVAADRKLQLTVRCNRAPQACRGQLVLRFKGERKRIARKAFRVPGGTKRTVTVRLTRASYARLLEGRPRRARAVASTRRRGAKASRRTRTVVLRAVLENGPQPAPPGPGGDPTSGAQPSPGSEPPPTGEAPPGEEPPPGGEPPPAGEPPPGEEPPPAPETDQQRASRIALKLSDMPAGWRTASAGGGAGQSCSVPGSGDVSARQPFRRFETGTATSAGSDVSVMTSEAAATNAHRVVPGEISRCFQSLAGSTVDGALIESVTATGLPSPGVGDRSSASRYRLDLVASGLSFRLVIDVVSIQRERAFAVLFFTELGSPFSAGLKGSLTSTVAARMAP